jgi:hypothetical protein
VTSLQWAQALWQYWPAFPLGSSALDTNGVYTVRLWGNLWCLFSNVLQADLVLQTLSLGFPKRDNSTTYWRDPILPQASLQPTLALNLSHFVSYSLSLFLSLPLFLPPQPPTDMKIQPWVFSFDLFPWLLSLLFLPTHISSSFKQTEL